MSRVGGKRQTKNKALLRLARVTENQMEELKQEMEKIWDEHNILQRHRDVITEQCEDKSNDVKAAMYCKEIESYQKKTSPIQKCMHGIIAREACLKNIVDLQTQITLEKEEQTESKIEGEISSINKDSKEGKNEKSILDVHFIQFVEHLHALRMFSINIVECIAAWKDHVLFPWRQVEHDPREHEPEIPFMYQGNNYLLKMRDDNAFLGMRNNPFSEYFNFATRGDPFLIVPSVDLVDIKKKRKKKVKSNKKKEKITVPIEPSILKKIKRCEEILEKEAKMNPDHQSSKSNLEPTITNDNEPASALQASPTKSFKSKKSILASPDKSVIAEIAAGPQEESVFVPKKNPECYPTQVVANVDSDAYRVEPLELKEKRALEFLDFYNQKCDKNMRRTFGVTTEVLKAAKMGLRPTWIQLRKGSKDAGLLIFNKDANVQNKNRYNILQMSVTHRSGLEEAIRLCLNYIWKNTDAEELRIGLHHFEVEEEGKIKSKVDEEYKSCLKRFNFRWKQMISEVGGKRILAMGLDRPKEYPLEQNVVTPFSIKLGVMLAAGDKSDTSTNPGKIDPTKSFFMTPNVYIQPLIYKGKENADEALFCNEAHTSKPLQLIHNWVQQVVDQIEFDAFPITKGLTSTDLTEAKTLIESYDLNIPDVQKEDGFTYASGAFKLETRPTAFDHCSLRGGTEFLRIKDKDLAMASHPKIPDGIVYMPLVDPNIGCFIFQKPNHIDISDVKSFNDFARDLIDVSYPSLTSRIYPHLRSLSTTCSYHASISQTLCRFHGYKDFVWRKKPSS